MSDVPFMIALWLLVTAINVAMSFTMYRDILGIALRIDAIGSVIMAAMLYAFWLATSN